MKYLLDAVVILIFLLCVAIGHKRGFIKTVTGIVAFVAALAVSSLLSGPIAGLVYDKAVEPSIVETVDTKLEEVEGSATEKLYDAYESLPDMVKSLLAQTGVENVDDLAQKLMSMDTNVPVSENINAVVEPILLPLIKAICSLLLFFIVYIVAAILLKMLDIVAKLPLLKQVNKALGLVGGIVLGALWALLAVTVLQILAATGVAGDTVTLQTIADTTIVNWIAGINPLSAAMQEILIIGGITE